MKDQRLLEANELFYYAWKFRDSKFVIILSEKNSISKIIDDLRVLQTSKINFNVVCEQSSKIKEVAKQLTDRGFPIQYCTDFTPVTSPAIYVHKNNQNIIDYSCEIAKKLNAERIFYLSKYPGIEIRHKADDKKNTEIKSYLSFLEVEELINSDTEISFPKEILKNLLSKENTEFSLLKCERGSLFKEIFSHEGHGTLITEKYSINTRQAVNSDIISIHRMLKPSIDAGWVLDITEDKIAELIGQFFVYTINSKVVAAAMIQDYGDTVELAKFCTIPRFQGRGGARKLAGKLIEEAKLKKKTKVFSLSTNEAMWNLFISLGMQEVDRNKLPTAWLKNYDLNRNSKAFQKKL